MSTSDSPLNPSPKSNTLVLTITGRPLDRVETIEGLQRGLSDVKAARTKPARKVFNRLRRKHGIPR